MCIQVARKSSSSNVNGKAEVHSSADDRTDKTLSSFMSDLDDALRKIFEESVTINHDTVTVNSLSALIFFYRACVVALRSMEKKVQRCFSPVKDRELSSM